MNQLDLHNRVAIVTGAARGIGYAVAERLLRSGAQVSLWDVDSARLEFAHDRLATLGRVECVPIDLTHADQVEMAAASG